MKTSFFKTHKAPSASVAALVVLMIGMGSSDPAWAAKRSKKVVSPKIVVPTTVEVDVPKTGISTHVDFVERRVSEKQRVEISVSNWTPNIHLPSRLGLKADFNTPLVSHFGIAGISRPILNGRYGILSGEILLGYSRLTRIGVFVSYATAPKAYEQNLHLLSLAAGPEWKPVDWVFGKIDLSPYLFAGVMPTAFLMTKTPLSEEYSELGLGAQGAIGVLLGLGHYSLNLGVLQTLGTVQENSLSAFGARAGLRIAL